VQEGAESPKRSPAPRLRQGVSWRACPGGHAPPPVVRGLRREPVSRSQGGEAAMIVPAPLRRRREASEDVADVFEAIAEKVGRVPARGFRRQASVSGRSTFSRRKIPRLRIRLRKCRQDRGPAAFCRWLSSWLAATGRPPGACACHWIAMRRTCCNRLNRKPALCQRAVRRLDRKICRPGLAGWCRCRRTRGRPKGVSRLT